MEIRLRRWNDYALAGDGFRVLITRYRPRGVRKEDEHWDAWWKEVAPSVELHALAYGKTGRPPLDWEAYRRAYWSEMQSPEARARIDQLAERARSGETLTLLCSSACVEEQRCHRSLLKAMVLERAQGGAAP